MTPEQQAQFESAVTAVRGIVGPVELSGITDDSIGSTVWDLYFDVQASVERLLGESR